MPLIGKRIVNTRATHQNSRFTALLQAHGAEVIEYPCIAIAPPEDDAPLRAALADLARFDWLVLTSANTVQTMAALFPEMEDAVEEIPIAAVGPATAKASAAYLGRKAILLPETFTAEALGKALPILPGQRVLIPASAIAPPTLAEQLTARGAIVTVVEAYRTIRGTGGADVAALLAQRRVDAVTFTSASTVDNFLARLESEGGSRASLTGVCLACIGPQTAAAAEAHGLTVDVMPATHTLDGLIAALGDYFVPVPAR
ncbi:uroporphyrinogen-III synthase [Armatimonas rosea]|uniref:Uroporphyrinogen-III synthase n=1 Tax=Armatimonas rosea TaxID=685828 RepID=A0A7W9SPY5_ARMRO|nr:uroporphyrinogen-III synthase [Armatimonas rosea]MBB6050666.1 uroporphyrinogen-III synthase [Armatimonas rosea]